jgi:hypothetical protein
MPLQPITDARVWDETVEALGGHPLQKWAWGELKAAHGWHAHRVVLRERTDAPDPWRGRPSWSGPCLGRCVVWPTCPAAQFSPTLSHAPEVADSDRRLLPRPAHCLRSRLSPTGAASTDLTPRPGLIGDALPTRFSIRAPSSST